VFVLADGSSLPAQLAAVDKGAVGVDIAGEAGVRAEGLARMVMAPDADVERGYMFALEDAGGTYTRYRVLSAGPPARNIERVCWLEVIDT
jgi:hypothetical protein